MPLRRPIRLIALLGLLAGMLLLDAQAGDIETIKTPNEVSRHDPIPIRRVVASAELIEKALRASGTEWRRLSRVEFEQLVRAAANGVKQTVPPRLVECRYRARLVGDNAASQSLDGTAEWKLINRGPNAGVMPLESLGIAIASARWTDNRNAVLGSITPSSPPGLALLVEDEGEQSLALEWSSRGVLTPTDLRFDLTIPASPIAAMELDLPRRVVPVFPQDEALVEGPFPHGSDSNRRIWRIAFGGLSHLEISLREPEDESARAPLLANQISRYDLYAENVHSQFTVEYQAPRGDVTSMLFEHGEELTPTDVNVLNLESWHSLPESVNGMKRLEVRLREPSRGGQIRITARSVLPLSEAKLWSAPSLRMLGAVTRNESIRFRIPTDLKLVDWRPGAFRLVRVEPAAEAATVVFEPERGPDGPAASARPMLRLQIAGTEFRVKQELIWDLAAFRSRFMSRMDLEVQRGAMHQLQCRLPAGAEVESVEIEPKAAGPIWSLKAGGSPLLQVDWNRPVVAGTQAHVIVHLLLPGVGAGGRQKAMTIPDVVPLAAGQRSGELVIRADPAFAIAAPAAHGDPGVVGPVALDPDIHTAKWVYRFFRQPPAGQLLVTSQSTRLTASIEQLAVVEGSRLLNSMRLSLHSQAGPLNDVILYASQPINRPLSWRAVQGGNPIVSVEPLRFGDLLAFAGTLGLRQPLALASRLAEPLRDRWWRLTFARPLSGNEVLESTFEAPDDQRRPQGTIRVPLLQVLNADRNERLLRLRLPANDQIRIAQLGMLSESRRRDVFGVETNYRIVDPNASLVIDLAAAAPNFRSVEIDSARLISVLDPAAGTRCWFAFRYRGTPEGGLPFRLARDSEVHSVAVAGRVLLPEQIRQQSAGEEAVYSIAAPTADRWQTVEILYSHPKQEWWLLTRLDPRLPRLPAEPGSLRVEWRLPPGAAPVNSPGWVQLPGGMEQRARSGDLSSVALFSRSTAALVERAPSRSPPVGKGAQSRTLQQVITPAASTAEKPLIDTVALAETGVRESTPMPAAGLESLGLTVVGFPGGTVLTTPRQLSIWQSNGLPASIQRALHDAAQHGRDQSGRFVTASEWLQTAAYQDPTVLLSHLGGDAPEWTAWESRDAVIPPLHVADGRHFTILGWLIAACLAAAGMLLVGRLGRTGIALLLFWLLAAGAALQWLPSAVQGLATAPMLAGLLVALISACRSRSRKKSDSRTVIVPHRSALRRPSSAVATGSALALLFALPCVSAVPEETTVYLLAGTADDPEPKTVYAPADLIERLKQLSNPKSTAVNHVWLRAAWSGRGEINSAEFDAQLVVYLFAERTTVELPAAETRLREILLDGAAAFPRANGNGRIALEIAGRGEHRIDLKLSASVTGTGADREIRFAVPECAVTRLDFQLPDGCENPQAINWQGAQRVSANGNQLHADLGRTKSIQLRWHQGSVSGKSQMRVQEASLWDLNLSIGTLYSAFDFRVQQGGAQSLRIALPPDVQISRVEIRSEAASGAAVPSWIRNWSVGADRILKIDLQTALTGSFQLIMEGVSDRSPSNRPILLFPRALDVSESDAHVAYRLRGLECPNDIERRGVTEIAADAFLKDVWRPANVEFAPAAVSRAFRKNRNQTPFLRPFLHHVTAASQASQELIWLLDAAGANVRGMSRWTAAAEPLSFVEWELPALVAVHDVRGLGVHSWLRAGNRVQVWLREPRQEVCLAWDGTIRRNSPPSESVIFDLPAVRLEGTQSATTVQRLRPHEGWALTIDKQDQLGMLISPLAERETAFLAPKAAAPARIVLRGQQTGARCQSISIAEVVDRRLRVQALLETNLRKDRPHALAIGVDNSSDWEIEVSGPSYIRAIPGGTQAAIRQWFVEVPSRDEPRCILTVSMSRPLSATRKITLPEISVYQGDRIVPTQSLLALLGPELRPAEGSRLRPVLEQAESIRAKYPREFAAWRARGGTLWAKRALDERYEVIAGPTELSSQPSVRIGLFDIETVHFGDRWISRAAVDLIHERGASLECTLPADSELAGIALDGVEMTVPSRAGRIRLDLPLNSAARLLQLVWTSRRQSWEAPVLSNGGKPIRDVPLSWNASAAPGEEIEVGTVESTALHHLRSAEALLRIAGDPEAAGWPEAVRQRLAQRALRRIRLAEAAVTGPRSDAFLAERGPNGIALSDWAARLREQAMPLRGPRPTPGVNSIREAGFDLLPFASVFRTGLPVRWSISAPSAVPEVKIKPPDSWTPIPAIASFGLIAAAVGLLGGLMLLLSRHTRPEQIVAIGLVGAVAFGSPEGFAFLGLALIGVLARIGWTGRRIYRWLGG